MARDLSASDARVFKLIRCSLSPVGASGGCGIVEMSKGCTFAMGCGMVMSKSCSFAMGWFVCFVCGDRQIIASAGRLVGASGIDPVDGSMMAARAAFVWLVSVSSGCSVVVILFVMAS